jgi:hypothetical protein
MIGGAKSISHFIPGSDIILNLRPSSAGKNHPPFLKGGRRDYITPHNPPKSLFRKGKLKLQPLTKKWRREAPNPDISLNAKAGGETPPLHNHQDVFDGGRLYHPLP